MLPVSTSVAPEVASTVVVVIRGDVVGPASLGGPERVTGAPFETPVPIKIGPPSAVLSTVPVTTIVEESELIVVEVIKDAEPVSSGPWPTGYTVIVSGVSGATEGVAINEVGVPSGRRAVKVRWQGSPVLRGCPNGGRGCNQSQQHVQA
jgi:hypothetical protein